MTVPLADRSAPDGLAAALVSRLGPSAHLDASLGALTTYRVGGRAAVMADVASEAELLALQAVLRELDATGRMPVLVLGNGSNLLVADAGFPGLVVRLGEGFRTVEVPEGADRGVVTVRAGGGVGLPVLARRTVRSGLTGLEWMVGIPGTVGGALKMNAGGHGSDTAACLVRYRAVDLAGEGAVEAEAGRLLLGYRSSSLKPSDVVVWADLAARPGDRAAGEATLSEIVAWRRAHQPGGSNAGSVFTNPPGVSAGRLVEAAGLKGFRLGSARVSEKHANFIQADDGGSADDVCALMVHVRRAVAAETGVLLHPEVKLVGFADDAAHEAGAGGDREPAGSPRATS